MNFNKSLELLESAIKVIPKGSQTASKCYDQWPKGLAPIFCKKADGCYIYDVDGNKFIDTMMSLGPILLGYNNTIVNKAIQEQLQNGIVFSLSSQLEIELAELIKSTIPSAEMIRIGKNGSDATSIAIRIARSYTGKDLVLSPEGHYHGWSDTFAAASSRNYGMPEYMQKLIHRCKYNDLNDLERYLSTRQYAAFIMEPVSLVEPSLDYLKGVRSMCSKYGVVLIFDEMITGFRWSLGGAQQMYNVCPDISTFGKAIANGMPISILAGKAKYMNELNKVFFSGTYNGELLSIAAAIATIKYLKDNEKEVYSHIWTNGNMLREAFNQHCVHIGLDAEMFGVAPRHNIRFNTPDPIGTKDLFHSIVIKNGVFVGTQIYTTWAHKKEHIEQVIATMKYALGCVKDALDNGNVNKLLNGARSKAIFKNSVVGKDNE